MPNYWFIGDIHGEAGLLDRLLESILKFEPEQIVFVGDYIDRGPNSREVVDRIMQLDVPSACLMGNHEMMLLNAIEDPGYGYSPVELWYYNGGEATLQSFGFTSFFSFQSEMQSDYLDFFRNLKMSHLVTVNSNLRILATHAGISPSIPLDDHLRLKDYLSLNRYLLKRQLDPEHSVLWVREPFFESRPENWNGYLVIHGHTPVMKLKRYVATNGNRNFFFVENDLCIRRHPENGRIVSIDVDSGSSISGRLSGMGFFSGGDDSMVRMRSITVSREDIFPRDLGPVS